jgi:electron transfer flavoprotein alpha/beta subunit
MGAKRKPQETLSLADLDLGSDTVGEAGSQTEVYALGEPPSRGESRRVEGGAETADAIVEFLAEKRLL